ncbi:MAG: hypothetical protein P1U86_10795 [Verrucomicrobiales bacterium]|nr:hypothetical protein [Verrucomicrobiales bacterium]
MKIGIKIIASIFAGLSFLGPFLYGLLFLVSGDFSAIVDFLVAAAVVGSALKIYVNLPISIWISAMTVFFGASTIGFFVHFRNSGESGPLPFEWLNQYYQFGLPAIILIGVAVRFDRREKLSEEI